MKRERGRSSYLVDKAFREQMQGVEDVLEDILPIPDDGYDTGPRPLDPVLEHAKEQGHIPLGHIAFKGDFDTQSKF